MFFSVTMEMRRFRYRIFLGFLGSHIRSSVEVKNGNVCTCQMVISSTCDIIHDTHDPVSGRMRMIDACWPTMVLTFSAVNDGS